MSPLPQISAAAALVARQIWTSSPPASELDKCITYTVQAPGFLTVNDSLTVNITEDAILKECGPDATNAFNLTIGDNSDEPYFASTAPVTFVLGICVTIAWILLLMLLMTPRTYLTGVGSSRRRPDTGINVVGVGSRPWFQKVAALFVAIALLLAAIQTFDKAEEQYLQHYQDSAQLTSEVLGSWEIRIVRFISTLFEWLAQAQTALRLFPRHRERIAIKWVALSLIFLEMVFSILNDFTSIGAHDDGSPILQPRNYQSVIPALQYLFELALSLMYAAVIFYYALTKRRYAFYHPDMWNISLVAILSLVAVLVPVVFFVLDIAVPNIAAWGTYVRWVGAAAASVVVWEWVERIEALEREERKDGILGREIFEGDEILGDGASRRRARRQRTQTSTFEEATSPVLTSSATDSSAGSTFKKSMPEPKSRYSRVNKDVLRKIATLRNLAKTKAKQGGPSRDIELQQNVGAVRRRRQRQAPTVGAQPPPMDPTAAAQQSASPVSRSDCTSASTVYRVVHHSISPSSTPGISETLGQTMNVISPVQEEPADESQERRRSFMGGVFPFRRQSSGQSSQNVPPEILAQQVQARAQADEEAASQTRAKSRFGIFSRFRRAPSEEQELPELVVPWRGENNLSPQTDLESGQPMHSPITYEDPTDEWHGHQRQTEPRSPHAGNDNVPP